MRFFSVILLILGIIALGAGLLAGLFALVQDAEQKVYIGVAAGIFSSGVLFMVVSMAADRIDDIHKAVMRKRNATSRAEREEPAHPQA